MNLEKKKDFLILILLILTILSAGTAIYFAFSRESTAVTPIEQSAEAVTKEPVVKNSDSIAIPGYEALVISKNTELCLSNPPQNMCYFLITLSLEDGTVLWQSDYVEPGGISDPITLNQELPNSTYPNARLKYSCFTMDEALTPLNGAETKLTLRVQN